MLHYISNIWRHDDKTASDIITGQNYRKVLREYRTPRTSQNLSQKMKKKTSIKSESKKQPNQRRQPVPPNTYIIVYVRSGGNGGK